MFVRLSRFTIDSIMVLILVWSIANFTGYLIINQFIKNGYLEKVLVKKLHLNEDISYKLDGSGRVHWNPFSLGIDIDNFYFFDNSKDNQKLNIYVKKTNLKFNIFNLMSGRFIPSEIILNNNTIFIDESAFRKNNSEIKQDVKIESKEKNKDIQRDYSNFQLPILSNENYEKTGYQSVLEVLRQIKAISFKNTKFDFVTWGGEKIQLNIDSIKEKNRNDIISLDVNYHNDFFKDVTLNALLDIPEDTSNRKIQVVFKTFNFISNEYKFLKFARIKNANLNFPGHGFIELNENLTVKDANINFMMVKGDIDSDIIDENGNKIGTQNRKLKDTSRFNVRWDNTKKIFSLEKFFFFLDDSVVSGNITADLFKPIKTLAIDYDSKNIELDEVNAFWPKNLAPNTHAWYEKAMRGGVTQSSGKIKFLFTNNNFLEDQSTVDINGSISRGEILCCGEYMPIMHDVNGKFKITMDYLSAEVNQTYIDVDRSIVRHEQKFCNVVLNRENIKDNENILNKKAIRRIKKANNINNKTPGGAIEQSSTEWRNNTNKNNNIVNKSDKYFNDISYKKTVNDVQTNIQNTVNKNDNAKSKITLASTKSNILTSNLEENELAACDSKHIQIQNAKVFVDFNKKIVDVNGEAYGNLKDLIRFYDNEYKIEIFGEDIIKYIQGDGIVKAKLKIDVGHDDYNISKNITITSKNLSSQLKNYNLPINSNDFLLKINDKKATFTMNGDVKQKNFKLKGDIDIKTEKSLYDLDFKEVNYADISEIFDNIIGDVIGIKGNISGKIKIAHSSQEEMDFDVNLDLTSSKLQAPYIKLNSNIGEPAKASMKIEQRNNDFMIKNFDFDAQSYDVKEGVSYNFTTKKMELKLNNVNSINNNINKNTEYFEGYKTYDNKDLLSNQTKITNDNNKKSTTEEKNEINLHPYKKHPHKEPDPINKNHHVTIENIFYNEKNNSFLIKNINYNKQTHVNEITILDDHKLLKTVHIKAKNIFYDNFNLLGFTRRSDNPEPVDQKIIIIGNAESLVFKDNNKFNNVEFNLSCDKGDCQEIIFHNNETDKKKKLYQLNASMVDDKILIVSNNAGILLKGLDVTEYIHGGQMYAVGHLLKYKDDKRMIQASVDINNFTVKNAPAIAQLLSLTAFDSIISLISGNGIAFDRMNVNLIYMDDKVYFSKSVAEGKSLGILFEGEIDLQNKTISMKGSLTPLNILNMVIRPIPIIGNFLVGSKGNGLFTIDFHLDGSMEDPDISVNPVEILTPYAIKKYFMKKSDLKDEKKEIEIFTTENPNNIVKNNEN